MMSYLLEVNPRASRTIPIISKVTDVPLVQIATKILLGKYSLSKEETGLMVEIFRILCEISSILKFALNGLDSKLGPEMSSTGEGIAIAESMKKHCVKHSMSLKEKNGNSIVVSTLDELES